MQPIIGTIGATLELPERDKAALAPIAPFRRAGDSGCGNNAKEWDLLHSGPFARLEP
jgi:hypothetical protein